MTVSAFALLALSSFVQVFLLGFQSRNVNHGNFGWAAATSFFIGLSQVAVWHRIMSPDAGWAAAIVYGGCGALAIVSSMWVHRRFIAAKGAARDRRRQPARIVEARDRTAPGRNREAGTEGARRPAPWDGAK